MCNNTLCSQTIFFARNRSNPPKCIYCKSFFDWPHLTYPILAANKGVQRAATFNNESSKAILCNQTTTTTTTTTHKGLKMECHEKCICTSKDFFLLLQNRFTQKIKLFISSGASVAQMSTRVLFLEQKKEKKWKTFYKRTEREKTNQTTFSFDIQSFYKAVKSITSSQQQQMRLFFDCLILHFSFQIKSWTNLRTKGIVLWPVYAIIGLYCNSLKVLRFASTGKTFLCCKTIQSCKKNKCMHKQLECTSFIWQIEELLSFLLQFLFFISFLSEEMWKDN